jgi:hypothetical protein
VGHGYGILPITTDVSPMAHAHNQAPGFRLFPRVRLKATKMDDRTLELWNFQDLPDLRNTPFLLSHGAPHSATSPLQLDVV